MMKCSALYCTNSSAKGFLMIKFPADKQKRMLWIKKMGRHNWIPNPTDTLCCVHFTRKLVTKRKSVYNGKCSIKITTLPTVFDYETIKERSKVIIEENAKKLGAQVIKTLCDSCESSKVHIAKLKKKVKQLKKLTHWLMIIITSLMLLEIMLKLSSLQSNTEKLEKKVDTYEILLSYFLSQSKSPANLN